MSAAGGTRKRAKAAETAPAIPTATQAAASKRPRTESECCGADSDPSDLDLWGGGDAASDGGDAASDGGVSNVSVNSAVLDLDVPWPLTAHAAVVDAATVAAVLALARSVRAAHPETSFFLRADEDPRCLLERLAR